ncbi:MAG TPA: sensor histidine kinase [Candidatus Limnocylindrales bacterium]|nr:sensor histidine kinase [Candidatus Limnocylindrales bacterium]
MSPDVAERQLLGAELWERGDATTSARFLAGWEDGATFCAAVCSTDLGLAFCRACPTDVANRALANRRATSGRCPAGVRLLAFPAPAGSVDRVAVLRVGPPTARQAVAVTDQVRVAPTALRRAAREMEPADGRASLSAARRLRDPAGNRDWQVEQRARGADRRRAAGQALAQMIATSEELHELYRASQRQRRQLDRNRRLVDGLARATLRAQDEERSRIAHEIHDTAAQSMVSAFRFLDAARAASGANGHEPDPRLVHASERLQSAIREVRAVLARLLPPGLEELGLADALRTRLNTAHADDGSHSTTGAVSGDLPRLKAWVEQALYGMASEAVSNAVRHGQATTIGIDLGVVRGRAVVTVTDDGGGFDPTTVIRTEGSGLGLVGLTRQASWLGGSARIVSRPGGGTTVRISIPLARHLRGSSGDEAGSEADATAVESRRSGEGQ